MELPMTAFTLGGSNGSISLEIGEVFGFPGETAYGGGYGAHGLLQIRVQTCAGTWTVDADHFFTTGELNRFEKDLARCYETLGGTATLENCENELELTLSVGKTGHATITGKFQELSEFENVLHFQIESDQTYIPKALSQLHRVTEAFGDHLGKPVRVSIPLEKPSVPAGTIMRMIRFCLKLLLRRPG